MGKFEDPRFAEQLFADLMAEHGDELAAVQRPVPARPAVPRPVWVAAAAVGLAGAVAAGMLVFDDGAPAYAVSRHSDGTVTVSISDISGVDGANAKLRELGVRAVAVPMRAGCPEPQPRWGGGSGTVRSRGNGGDGMVTFDADDIPAESTVVLAAQQLSGGRVVLNMATVGGPVPSCLPAAPTPGGDRKTGYHDDRGGSSTVQDDRGGSSTVQAD